MALLQGKTVPDSPKDIDSVKIMVVGEAGVGKTTFVQSAAGRPIKNPPWTVGCSVQVLIHSYKAGTQHETPYFVELWDVGGSRSHRNSRRVFYQNMQGVVLVYDCQKRKTLDNLNNWMWELFSDGKGATSPFNSSFNSRLPTTIFDGEHYAGERNSPVLIVGSMLDQEIGNTASGGRNISRTPPKIATDCKSEEIVMDCRQPISPGSTNGLKLVKFFDKVIECHTNKTKSSGYAMDRKRNISVERKRRLF